MLMVLLLLAGHGDGRGVGHTMALGTDNPVGFPGGNCSAQVQEVGHVFGADVVVDLL
jgi:hypothetical protein